MLNTVALMGRICGDPELRTTNSGVSVTSFTMAVNRAYVKQGEQRQTDFIDVAAWKNTADFVCKYFRKGQLIAVQGSIQTRTYTDKNGNKRKAVEVVAENVHFAEGKKKEEGPAEPYGTAPGFGPEYTETPALDEDLPF